MPVSVPIGEAGDEESPTIGAFDSEAEKRQLAVKAKVPYKIDLHCIRGLEDSRSHHVDCTVQS